MLKKAIIAAIVLAVPIQANAESWLCAGDLANGLAYNKANRTWEPTRFNAKDTKFIIRPSDHPTRKYEVNEFGKPEGPFPDYACKVEPNEAGYLFCSGLFGEFKFNTKNLRYIRVYLAGYIEIMPSNTLMAEGEDTPMIEIGRCSKI
jgi:hypothetical protein